MSQSITSACIFYMKKNSVPDSWHHFGRSWLAFRKFSSIQHTVKYDGGVHSEYAAHACSSRSRFFFVFVFCKLSLLCRILEKNWKEQKNKKISIYVHNLKQQYKIQEIEDGGTNNSLQS